MADDSYTARLATRVTVAVLRLSRRSRVGRWVLWLLAIAAVGAIVLGLASGGEQLFVATITGAVIFGGFELFAGWIRRRKSRNRGK